jgi:hypothetical protein
MYAATATVREGTTWSIRESWALQNDGTLNIYGAAINFDSESLNRANEPEARGFLKSLLRVFDMRDIFIFVALFGAALNLANRIQRVIYE